MTLSFISVHRLFDYAGFISAAASGFVVYKWRLYRYLPSTLEKINGFFFLSITLGSFLGAYGFGTANLVLSDLPGSGRSIIGGLAGAIFAVELYKYRRKICYSTGYMYVIPLCVGIGIGRLGCLFSGLEDMTYGIPTQANWGWDFGDHILRHPVALYESIAMGVALLIGVWWIYRRPDLFARKGFYAFIGFYSAQRWALEFLKPYSTTVFHHNIFQLLCLVLIVYAVVMSDVYPSANLRIPIKMGTIKKDG